MSNAKTIFVHRAFSALAALSLILLAGCESSIQPMKPLQRVELWVPDDGSAVIELSPPTDVPAAHPALAEVPLDIDHPEPPAPADTEPATIPAPVFPMFVPSPSTAITTAPAVSETQPAPLAAASEPATQDAATQQAATTLPAGKKVIKIIDPNQTARFVYKASYDNVWQQSMLLASRMGFTIDRHDYRLGVITTRTLPSAQVVEPWKPQQTTLKNALENTINSQRRTLRIKISQVPGKPDFYQVAVQVLVERETNPSELVGGPIFVEGSGFGRNIIALRSDYAPPIAERAHWITLGHDTQLEKKLLDQIFKRI